MKPELQNLKTNDLKQVALKVESYYERHDAAIRWGIIAVAFVLACGIYWWRVTGATEAAAWNQLSQSNSAEDFSQVVSDFPNSRATNWAKLREANSYLETGLRDAFQNREKANTDLKKAKGILESLRSVTGPRDLKQQAMFAYARCLEMTSEGDLKPAIEAYKALLTQYPETPFKRDAENRIKALGRPSAAEFYAYFSKQKPMPEERPKPNDAASKASSSAADDPFQPLSKGLEDVKRQTEKAEKSGTPLLLPPTLPDLTAPEKPSESEKKPAEEKKPDSEKSSDTEAKPDPEKPATKDKQPEAEKSTSESQKSDEGPALESTKSESPKPEDKSKPDDKSKTEDKPKAEDKPSGE